MKEVETMDAKTFVEKLKNGEIVFEKGRYKYTDTSYIDVIGSMDKRAEKRYKRVREVQDLPPKKENKKVRNATKTTTIDGTPADSKLEAYAHDLLRSKEILFQYKKTFILLPGFIHMGKKIRRMTWTPDFTIPLFSEKIFGVALDTKGFATDVAKIKIKIFKFNNPTMLVIIASTRNEVKLAVEKIAEMLLQR